MSIPRVSVVIVNWKTPQLLANCLRSLRTDRGYRDFEIFVVDNASGDGSVDLIARDFPNVALIANDENVGFPKACNQAIAQAQGQYILLLNPDTYVVGDAISELACYLDQNHTCGAVGPKILNKDGSLQLACRRSFPDPLAALFRVTYLSWLFPKHPLIARYNLTYKDPDSILEVDGLSGSCMMVRRSAIERVGMLDDEWFMYGEELDWCWRIKQAGMSIVYYPASVIYHYHGAASRLRPVKATIALHHGLYLFYRKHIAERYWAPVNWAIYSAIWMRALIFVLIGFLRGLFPGQKHVPRDFAPLPASLQSHDTAKEAEFAASASIK
jgi:GT2 family glycosyltransferase